MFSQCLVVSVTFGRFHTTWRWLRSFFSFLWPHLALFRPTLTSAWLLATQLRRCGARDGDTGQCLLRFGRIGQEFRQSWHKRGRPFELGRNEAAAGILPKPA